MRKTAFDGLSKRKDIALRYDRIRGKNEVIGNKWADLIKSHFSNRAIRVLVIGPGTGMADYEPIQDAITEKYKSDTVIHIVDFDNGEWGCMDAWLRAELSGTKASTEKYDIVVGQQVLQHTTDWRSFFYVLYKHLKPGGFFAYDSFDAPLFQAIQGQTYLVDPSKIKDAWERFFHIEYRKREYSEGIFWDPEFPSNKPERLASLLEILGFQRVDTGEPVTTNHEINKDDLLISFNSKEYGPLFWGSEANSPYESQVPQFPNENYRGNVTYALHVFKIPGVDEASFLRILSNVKMLNTRAVLRLDTHLRYDLAIRALGTTQDDEQPDRIFLSYIQSLLFSGSVSNKTNLLLPILSRIKSIAPEIKEEIPSKQFGLVLAGNESKRVIDILHRHTATIMKEMPDKLFTEFLAQYFGRPVTIMIQTKSSTQPEIHVKDCDFGLLINCDFPKNWEVSDSACSHSGVDEISGRLFSQYLLTRIAIIPYEESCSHSKAYEATEIINSIKKSLHNVFVSQSITDFSKGTLDNMTFSLASYLYATRYLWSSYKVIFYIIHQILPYRENPEIRRDSYGIGSVLMLEDKENAERMNVLSSIDMDRLALLHVITREFAAATVFRSLEEIGTEAAQNKALVEVHKVRAETYELLRPHVEQLLSHLSKAEQEAAFVRSIVQPPALAIIGAGESTAKFFKESSIKIDFAGHILNTHHVWKQEKSTECFQLVGAAILTAMGMSESSIREAPDLWEYSKSVIAEHSDERCQLQEALKKAILEGSKDKGEDIFSRAVNCFHSPYKAGKLIPASLIVACFPSTFEALKEVITERYQFQYGNNTPEKLNCIFDLLRPYGENYTVDISLPTTGRANKPGFVIIKATGVDDRYVIDCQKWTKLKDEYGRGSTTPTKGNLVDMLSAYFGNSQELKCDEGKVSIEENEYLSLLKDSIEIKFIIYAV